MKHKMPTKPTREQKKRLSGAGYDWKRYLIKDVDNISIAVIDKETGRIEVIFC